MIKNIVFDIGNVLVDFKPLEYFKQFGYSDEINKRLEKEIFMGKDWIECDRGTHDNNSSLVNILIEKYPELKKEITKTLTPKWVKLLTPKQESIDFLKEMKQKGYQIYLFSNLSKESFEYVKEQEYFQYIDGGIFSYQEKMIKPNRDIYERLLEKYNLIPEETIFIDDSKANIETTKQVGIHGVLFENINQAKKDVNDLIEQ